MYIRIPTRSSTILNMQRDKLMTMASNLLSSLRSARKSTNHIQLHQDCYVTVTTSTEHGLCSRYQSLSPSSSLKASAAERVTKIIARILDQRENILSLFHSLLSLSPNFSDRHPPTRQLPVSECSRLSSASNTRQ